MRRAGGLRIGVGCGLVCLHAAAVAEPPPEAPPDPLTLEAAMAFADAAHPELERARAGLEAARAERRRAEAITGIEVTAEAGAEVLDPSDVADDPQREDYRLELAARKPIYDFGRSGARVEAAAAGLQSSEVELAATRQQRRLDIMRRFFDVILADLRYARDNEAMAVAYVELDRMRGRNELGQASDIDLAEAEARYQRLRRRRYESDAQRRTARARLAHALNRPGRLPGDLVEPELPGNERERPDEVGPLIERALSDNSQLRILRARAEAARARVAAARAGRRPRLTGELETGTFHRELGSRDDWSAELILEVPLYTGGRVSADAARARAEARRLEQEAHAVELDVRQAVRETWERIGVLQARRDEARAETDYRELYLDRSRTRYAQELQADLGDSMVRWSEARLERARTEFALAQAWGRLDALLGRQVMPEIGADGG